MSLVGSVKWFNAKKGYGFVTVLTQDQSCSNTDVFVHFSNLNIRNDEYKRLFPGEYVSFNLGKNKDGRDICIDMTGVMGGPLLTENTEHRYRYFPKESRQQEQPQRQPPQQQQQEQEQEEAPAEEEATNEASPGEEDENDPEA
jgi:CspA family cold shock protein